MHLQNDKIKVLPSRGNIFEGYGLLIFYKKGHFKFNFSYFDKNPPPFPTEEKWKKNSQNSKMLSNISKKCFYTNFKSTSDDVISFEKLAWRHFVWRAFHILFDKLQDYDEVYLQVNFESHSCCKQCFRDGYFNYSLPNILWYLKTPVCIELRYF